MKAICAIDQGTSGTKSIVITSDDEILSVIEQSIHPVYLDNGGVEQDPEEMWLSVETTAKQAIAQARQDHPDLVIEAISLTNQGETVLAWDKTTGKPLSPMIVWQDRRSEDICNQLRDHAENIAAKTGLVLESYFSAPKMRWIRENITTEGVVTTSDTWLLYRLTGEFVTDSTTASRSLLCDMETGRWNPELLDIFGWSDEDCPTILPNDAIVGTSHLFGAAIPVCGIIVDQQAALLAQGCLAPGQAKCTFGTGAFLLAHAGNAPILSTSGLATSLAWETEGKIEYCFDAQIYTAASAVRWLQNTNLLEGPEHIDVHGGKEGSNGVRCIPAFAGLASPWWKPDAKAAFTGIGLSTTPGNIVCAVIEGIAAQAAVLASTIGQDTKVPLSILQVDGGLTRSKFLMQSLANLAQVTVQVYASEHATPLGGVTLARKALETSRSLASCVPSFGTQTTYEPSLSPDEAQTFVSEWRRVAETMI